MNIPLFDLINIVFPELIKNEKIIILDNSDGKGPIISVWPEDTPKPTEDDLDNLRNDNTIKAKYQSQLNKEHNAPLLISLEEIDFKSIRAVREGNQEYINMYDAEAQNIRSQLLPTNVDDILNSGI